ncbi:MAG TPA: hypothetical protein VHG71_04690 [Verrucomicrobiae bacterium]|nr:hypothetical protein [Verrucomicrobiae bacterium]
MAELKAVNTAMTSAEIRWSCRVLMLLLNFIPAIHSILVATIFLMPFANWKIRIAIALAVLYLLPPLIARVILFAMPISAVQISVGSKTFFSWWTTFQLQIVFCRLPFLEEILRLVPGLYSNWLRLWGSRIGRFTYWSPGTTITDRSFLRIGDDVVFGAGVRLNAHVLTKNKDGKMELLLADLKIGDRAVIGGYSLLTAGTEISADETTRARLLSPPFSVLKDGKRIKGEQSNEIE